MATTKKPMTKKPTKKAAVKKAATKKKKARINFVEKNESFEINVDGDYESVIAAMRYTMQNNEDFSRIVKLCAII